MTVMRPNCRSTPSGKQSLASSRLLICRIRICVVFTLLVGVSQPGLSQSDTANARSDGASIGTKQDASKQDNSPHGEVCFVTPDPRLVKASAESTAPALIKLLTAPPLSIADYENYIRSNSTASPQAARLPFVPLSPNAPVQSSITSDHSIEVPPPTIKLAAPTAQPQKASRMVSDARPTSATLTVSAPLDGSGDVLPPRRIAFAAPSVPSLEASQATKLHPVSTPATDAAPILDSTTSVANIRLRSKVAQTGRDIFQAANDWESTDHTLVVSKVDRESDAMTRNSVLLESSEVESYSVPSSAPELRVAMLEESSEAIPTQPIPTESTAGTVPGYRESIPTSSADDPMMPLTKSNFLPANPESYCFRCGVQCPGGCNPGGPGWNASRPIPWEVFAQGEYVGPARLAHVPVYRVRVDDRISFVYRLSGQVAGQPYRFNVRDRILIQSLTAPEVVNREVVIQPDGSVTLPLVGQFPAAGLTVEELSRRLDDRLKNDVKDPRITITPLTMNSNLEELRSSVDRRFGEGGQISDARVSPDGTIQLPAVGSVPAQGLTLEELEREVKARYGRIVEGLEVTPILVDRAPRYVFVVGEVKLPGRYSLEGPTSLMQAIALAGSWNVGAQLDQVVVFRRDENWQLMATKANIRSALLFKKPCPDGEIWLRDSDIVLVPKSRIRCADDFIELAFTRGIYGVLPLSATLNFAKLSTL